MTMMIVIPTPFSISSTIYKYYMGYLEITLSFDLNTSLRAVCFVFFFQECPKPNIFLWKPKSVFTVYFKDNNFFFFI